MSGETTQVPRVQFLFALHTIIDMFLQPLVVNALCGFTVCTFDHFCLRSHLLLVSYIDDTPEAE